MGGNKQNKNKQTNNKKQTKPKTTTTTKQTNKQTSTHTLKVFMCFNPGYSHCDEMLLNGLLH